MESVSLQNLIKDVAAQLRDLATGVTTTPGGINVSQFVDTAKSSATGGVDRRWQSSQVVFEEPAYTAAGCINPGPHDVTAFTDTTGLFTSNKPFRSAGTVAAGLVYFMVRAQGRGTPYDLYLAALRYALDELNVSASAVDSSLTTAASTYEYTIPGTLGGVSMVEFVKTGLNTLRLMPRDWGMKPGRKLWLKNLNLYVAYGWTLRLYGILESALPTTLDATVYCPRSAVVDLATEYLLRTVKDGASNARAGQRQQERLRFNRMNSMPNLRMVIP